MNLRSEEQLKKVHGFNYTDVWQSFYWSGLGLQGIDRCQSFMPSLNVTPSNINFVSTVQKIHEELISPHSYTPCLRQLAFTLDGMANFNQYAVINLSDPYQMVTSPGRHFGTEVLTILAKRSMSYFLVAPIRIKNINNRKQVCDESKKSKLSICMENYVQSQMPCLLPWRESTSIPGTIYSNFSYP